MSRTAAPLGLLADRHFTAPLYTLPQTADIVAVPGGTLRDWAQGYVRKRVAAPPSIGSAIITTAEPLRGRRPVVPFVGLAETYTLAAFRAAGVPLQRIRPAVAWIQEHIGLEQALASERLRTDGAEVLYDFGRDTDDRETAELVEGLVVVRSGQQVFRSVVQDYLARLSYRDGWVDMIDLPGYEAVEVVVDPYRNGGQPTVARRGVRVSDVLSRVRFGEPPDEVALDYGLRPREVAALVRHAV